MPNAEAFFKNAYTFTIEGMPNELSAYENGLTSNAIEVIEYVSEYIKWEGTLDFVLRFNGPTAFNHDGSGLLPSYGGVHSSGKTFAQYEATTGTDGNGSDYDAGAWILPSTEGQLQNYGAPLFIDASPAAKELADVPYGEHDFFSIYLHEILHSLGFWSVAQHGSQYGKSAFDDLTEERGDQFYFTGDATEALLGESLPLARSEYGTRDHYGTAINHSNPVERGAVFEFGNYEQNRWHLGQLELAVLSDLGYETANRDELPLVEVDDRDYRLPTHNIEVGTVGAEEFEDNERSQNIDGKMGRDAVVYQIVRDDAELERQNDGIIVVRKNDDDIDRLDNIEVIKFSDGKYIYDLDSDLAPQAYRLYGGAFDRVPDEAGLRFWSDEWLESGNSLKSAATGFVQSDEFRDLYGSELNDVRYVEQLYQNVLGRSADGAGADFWEEFLKNGDGDRADVLVNFTESPEFVGLMAENTSDGFWVS